MKHKDTVFAAGQKNKTGSRGGLVRADRDVALCIALTLAAFLFYFFVFGMRYGTNDDATISNIAAGAYGDEVLRLVYVNFIVSLVLRPLYMINGSFNWYEAFLLALCLLSCVILCVAIVRKLGKKGLFVALLFYYRFGCYIFTSFQYVKTSRLIITAGLVFTAAKLGQPLKHLLPGILLALAGSMIRFDNFIAVGALFSFILLKKFFSLDSAGKRRAASAMACMFALIFAAKAADVIYYNSDRDWKWYMEYNKARTLYSDYKYSFMPRENIFSDDGISDNDYRMLANWDFYDPEVFPRDRIRKLAESVPSPTLKECLVNTFKTFIGLLHGRTFRLGLAILLALCLLTIRQGKNLVVFAGTCAMFLALLFYLNYRGRFPIYREVGLMFAFLSCLVYCIADEENPRKILSGKAAVAAVLCLTAAFLFFSYDDFYREYDWAQGFKIWRDRDEEYMARMSEDKDHFYLIATVVIDKAAGYDLWHPRGENFFDNIAAYGGWLSGAPHRQRVLKSRGLERPLVDAVDNEKVRISYPGIDRALRYVQEHTGRDDIFLQQTGDNPAAPYIFVTEQHE